MDPGIDPPEGRKRVKTICFPDVSTHLASPKRDNIGTLFRSHSGSPFSPGRHFARQRLHFHTNFLGGTNPVLGGQKPSQDKFRTGQGANPISQGGGVGIGIGGGPYSHHLSQKILMWGIMIFASAAFHAYKLQPKAYVKCC